MKDEARNVRPEKESVVEEFREHLGNASYFLLLDYKGLTVGQLNDLRARLREHQARFHIVKNRLLRHVVRDMGLESVTDELVGPTGVIFGEGDVSGVAKALKKFIGALNRENARAGAMGELALTAADISELAALPFKKELQAMVVGTLAAPMSQLVGVLSQKTASIVYLLKAFEDKKQQEG
ncbi:MAG: 50S ribosomal protein L10 [Verrucomicrobia bacterium]|nr:50S ribosomal protein L10 [Verrucomicrobiota bacterium]MDA1085755.1 50S ribosomal protein L10 [Verrucomicrobiota bacterium]